MSRRSTLCRVIGASSCGLVLMVASFLFGWTQQPPATGEKGPIEPVRGKAAEPPPGVRRALLIGINKYKYMRHLDYCANDMKVLKEKLVKFGGYSEKLVTLFTDIDRPPESIASSTLLIELDQFLESAGPGDTVLIAFSGHGACDENGQNYWMPCNGYRKMIAETALSMARVEDLLRTCKARQKILILDCCHSGSEKAETTTHDFDPDKLAPGKGIVRLFSCSRKQYSVESPEHQRGVFSHFLSEALEGKADETEGGNRDGHVTVTEAYDYVHKHVKEWVKTNRGLDQTPQIGGTYEGSIVLASRMKPEKANELPDPALLAEQLRKLGREGRLPKDLVSSAERWLSADPGFGPGDRIRVLLSLLADRKITVAQFSALTSHEIPTLESHLTALSARTRQVRTLIIGINKYGGRFDLFYAVQDARLFRNALGKHAAFSPDGHRVVTEGGGAAQVWDVTTGLPVGPPTSRSLAPDPRPHHALPVLNPTAGATLALLLDSLNRSEEVFLTDEAATKPAVTAAIRRAVEGTRARDLVMIYFSGQGVYEGFEQRKKYTGREKTGWFLSGSGSSTKPAAIAPHRGLVPLDDKEFMQRSNVLPIEEVATLIKDCPADVLIISDSCYVQPDWPELFPIRPPPAAMRGKGGDEATPTRVFLGNGDVCYEDAGIGGCLLTHLVVRAVGGDADQETPRTFRDRIPVAPFAEAPTGQVPADELARPDGSVSLRELATYVHQKFGTARLTAEPRPETQPSLVFKGWFGDRDVVLTRPANWSSIYAALQEQAQGSR